MNPRTEHNKDVKKIATGTLTNTDVIVNKAAMDVRIKDSTLVFSLFIISFCWLTYKIL